MWVVSEIDILKIYYIPKPILLILIIMRANAEAPPGEACLYAEQVKMTFV